VTTTILAILMSAPFSTAVDCSEIVGYDEKKDAYLMECTLAVGGKTRDKTKLIPVYCIMDMKESAFMCKFNLKPKSSSDTVPRGRTGLLPQLPPGAVLQSTVPLPKRSLRPICLPAVRSPELNDELSQ
jgi:hypothetical protein